MKTNQPTTPTELQPLSNSIAQALFDDLRANGYGVQINKKQYAEISLCSVSAVDHYIAKGYGIPNYRKIGHQKNREE